MEVHQVSQRRACIALNVDCSTVRYQAKRDDDAEQRRAIKRIAKERRRFGYRRILVMLEREKIFMNHKKLRRIYREEGLKVRKRSGRKRALGTRRPMIMPATANQRWSLDFVSDALSDGRRFHIFAIVDEHTCECLPLCRTRHFLVYGLHENWIASSKIVGCPEPSFLTMALN